MLPTISVSQNRKCLICVHKAIRFSFLHRWALLAEGLACCAWFQQLEEMQRQEQQHSEQHHLSMRQNNGEISCAARAVSQRCLRTDCDICKAVFFFFPPSCYAGRNDIDGKTDIIMRQSESRLGWSYSNLTFNGYLSLVWLITVIRLLFVCLYVCAEICT